MITCQTHLTLEAPIASLSRRCRRDTSLNAAAEFVTHYLSNTLIFGAGDRGKSSKLLYKIYLTTLLSGPGADRRVASINGFTPC